MWILPSEMYSLLGMAIIAYLFWLLIKSAGKKIGDTLDSVDKTSADAAWEEYKRKVGPMTWGERIFIIGFSILFIAFVVWLANVI